VNKNSPIGIFDSGVGGLSVAREIFKQLPGEDIIYFGDTAHVPYGEKTVEQLISYGDQITQFLIEKGAKVIVVACNTSSAVSLSHLLNKFNISIIDVISPSIDIAIQATQNNKIGIIGTVATINSGMHKKLLVAKKPDLEVYPVACPKFVPLVEKGDVAGEEARQAAYEYLMPLKEKGVDSLILGCTHYPFLEKVIKEVLGDAVQIIDPALETVLLTKKILKEQNLLNEQEQGKKVFYVSGNPDSFLITGEKFLGDTLQNVKKVTL